MLDVYLNEVRRLQPERGMFGRRTKRQENFIKLVRIYAAKIQELYKIVESAIGSEPVFNQIRDIPPLKYLDSHQPLSDEAAIEFHGLVSELEEGRLPFRTYEVEEKISNIVRLKDLLNGSLKEVEDINMDRQGTYLWLEGIGYLEVRMVEMEKKALTVLDATVEKKIISLKTKDRKRSVSEEIAPDHFYESDMTDPPYDAEESVGQNEDGEDIIRGFFENSETIERLRILEAKMAPLIRWYVEIVSKEKKAGEGKLAGVRNLQEFAAPMKFLDRNFYYVNVRDYRHIFFATDIHGSEQAFRKVLKATDFLGANRENDLWIFLGDYVDRGGHDYWILYHLLKMKQTAPDNVIILKGNHEYYPIQNGSVECQHVPNDFYEFMFAERRDSQRGPAFSAETLDLFFKGLFPLMASGVFLKGKKTYFAAHSGFIHQTVDIDFKKLWASESDYFRLGIDRFPETACLADLNSDKNLRDLLWTLAVQAPYRDSFGKEVCLYSQANFMDKYKIDKVIRGHEHPLKGLECVNGKTKHELEIPGLPPGVMDEARVLTLFSAGHNDDLDHFRTYRSVVLKIDDEGSMAPLMIDGDTA